MVSKLVYMHKSDREVMGGQSVDFRFGGGVKDGEGSVRRGGIKLAKNKVFKAELAKKTLA